MNTSCEGSLVVPVFAIDENVTSLVDCISARVYFKEIYDVVQYGGAVLFSLGAISNFFYLILSQKRVKGWNILKSINLQLLIAALCHVIWLWTDMLSFKNFLPVLAERLLRDIPCWIFVSVMFHFLSIWYNANNAMKLGGQESKLFNFRNVYLFQAFSILLDLVLRITQQIYNKPALFSFFEGIYMIMLSAVSLLFVILCHILLYQARSFAHVAAKSGTRTDKLVRFYDLMLKFYFIMAPGGFIFVVLGICLVATRIIYLPIVIAAEHLWTICLHFFSWASLNLILWNLSFKDDKGTAETDESHKSRPIVGYSSSRREEPMAPLADSPTVTIKEEKLGPTFVEVTNSLGFKYWEEDSTPADSQGPSQGNLTSPVNEGNIINDVDSSAKIDDSSTKDEEKNDNEKS